MKIPQNEILKNELIIRGEMNLVAKKLLTQFMTEIQMVKLKACPMKKFNFFFSHAD